MFQTYECDRSSDDLRLATLQLIIGLLLLWEMVCFPGLNHRPQTPSFLLNEKRLNLRPSKCLMAVWWVFTVKF
jgi:hypothetical protein